MKKTAFISFVIIFCLSLCSPSLCEEFVVSEWSAFSGVSSFISEEGIVKLSSSNSFPLIISRDNLFINANRFTFLQLSMSSNKSYQTGRIFFKRIGDRDFNYMNSLELQTGLSGIYHDYLIDIKRNPNWFGTITQLMLSPINDRGFAEIKSVIFLEPNPWLIAKASWQEFFTFERPVPRTINVIFGPQINGGSINIYIYYAIFMLSLLYLGYALFQVRNFMIAFNRVIPAMILLCFIFWVTLDARLLLDQVRYAVLNYQIFGGKSLSDKQALSTFQNFYDYYYFLDFCRSKLPERASYSLLVPDEYTYYDVKARYYLYPVHQVMSPGAKSDYIIVYGPQQLFKGKDLYPKGFKLFTKYKDEGYILKRSDIP